MRYCDCAHSVQARWAGADNPSTDESRTNGATRCALRPASSPRPCFIVAVAPAHALAWANGAVRDGVRGQGYGTHDWVLDRAIALAGAQGAWVVRSAALGATDDPDFIGSPAEYHVYLASGGARGAAHAVSGAYSKAVAAYQAGDRVAASRYLGRLSHYYSDTLQPFHTVNASSRPGSLHWSYESASTTTITKLAT